MLGLYLETFCVLGTPEQIGFLDSKMALSSPSGWKGSGATLGHTRRRGLNRFPQMQPFISPQTQIQP